MNSSNVAAAALLAYEESLARLIIATVVEATPHIGRPPSRSFVASVLVGSVRRDLVAADAHRLSTFGVLARQGLDFLHEAIETLLRAGLLETVRSQRAIVCTAAGRAFMEGEREPEALGLLPGCVNLEELDLATRAGLLEALRRYRTERANELEVPEYRLLADATLREIAARQPRTTEELSALPGIGPKTLAQSGGELLRIVAEHLPIVERLRVARTGATT